ANSETRDPREPLHCYLAFRRRKDNADGPMMCYREIIRDEAVDLERLKVRCRQVPGVWRIHHTVHARSVAEATTILMHRLIDNPTDAEALETIWKTCLLKRTSRATRLIMINVDDPSAIDVVVELMGDDARLVKTPSGGYHVWGEVVDTRPFETLE